MRVTNGLAVFIGFRHRRRPFWRVERKKEGVQMRVQNGLGRMIKLAQFKMAVLSLSWVIK